MEREFELPAEVRLCRSAYVHAENQPGRGTERLDVDRKVESLRIDAGYSNFGAHHRRADPGVGSHRANAGRPPSIGEQSPCAALRNLQKGRANFQDVLLEVL